MRLPASRALAVAYALLGLDAGAGCLVSVLCDPNVKGLTGVGQFVLMGLLAVGLLGVIFLGHVVALLPAAARATVTMDGDRIVALESWFLTVRDCLLMPGTASVAGCEVAAPVALLVPGRSESWGVVEPGQVVRVRRGPMLLCSIAMGLPSPWCAIAAPSEGGTYLLPRDGKRLTRL